MRFWVEAPDPGVGGAAICDAVQKAQLGGGKLVEIVDEATHILTDHVEDPSTALGLEAHDREMSVPAKRTSAWVNDCCQFRTTVWPSAVLMWKGWNYQPLPKARIEPVDGRDNFVITLTGYTGLQREVLKRLIEMTGAEKSDALTRKNTHLLCNAPTSKKAEAAKLWGVKVVNHLWIMDSVVAWRWQPEGDYNRSGESILAEGCWTLLDEETMASRGVIVHPRLLAERTPLPPLHALAFAMGTHLRLAAGCAYVDMPEELLRRVVEACRG